MPGVIRPYTLVDILGTLNDQNGLGSQGTAALTTPLSAGGEVDEAVAPQPDSAFAYSSVDIGWDQGTWGGIQWN